MPTPSIDIKQLRNKLKIGKSKKDILVLVVALYVAIVLLYFLIFFKPAVSQLNKVLPQISGLRNKLNAALLDIESRPLLEAKEEKLRSKIDYYEKRLPSEKEIPKLLEQLSEIALGSNVKILAITPVEVKSDEGAIYKQIPISIEAKCGYHQLGQFIQKLEHAARFMKIGNIYIEADQSDISRHRVKLEIVTYTLAKEK